MTIQSKRSKLLQWLHNSSSGLYSYPLEYTSTTLLEVLSGINIWLWYTVSKDDLKHVHPPHMHILLLPPEIDLMSPPCESGLCLWPLWAVQYRENDILGLLSPEIKKSWQLLSHQKEQATLLNRVIMENGPEGRRERSHMKEHQGSRHPASSLSFSHYFTATAWDPKPGQYRNHPAESANPWITRYNEMTVV